MSYTKEECISEHGRGLIGYVYCEMHHQLDFGSTLAFLTFL